MPTQATLPCAEPAFTAGPSEPSSTLLEFFLVQGMGFRCVAYRDRHGQWRDALNNQELLGEISVVGDDVV